MPTLPTFIQHSLEVIAREIRQNKEIKIIQVGKEEVKVPLFADGMILYIENPKYSTKKLLDLLNEFRKVARYKQYTEICCIPIK